MTDLKQSPKNWWKEMFIYQIYPRSFRDSNGDGIGDLPGITQSLDYLKDLGVEAIWLSPIYKSPNDDNGYDVSNYCDIMDEFGTLADFDEMLSEMKKRDLKLILDLVPNHSSDEHEWFQQARQSKDSPYRDYYIWKEGKGDQPPNNWVSIFGGSAWEYNEATQDYYLHLFSKKQPDLNWENPKVRQEMYQAMRFWLDKGIDGFRLDVIPFISKPQDFPDVQADKQPIMALIEMCANGPRMHEFLQEMHQEVLAHYDCFTVGEAIGVGTQEAPLYVAEARKELHTIYHFDHMFLNRDPNHPNPVAYKLSDLKQVISAWDKALENEGWNTFYLGNHDQPRAISRFGHPAAREASGKVLATLLFTLRAIPFVYQGDEFGMINQAFSAVDQINDIDTLNQYQEYKAQGGAEGSFLLYANQISRDHARTPFQWDDSAFAGFTKGEKPWLMVHANYTQINATQAQQDENSLWNYYKQIIALRKNSPCLIYGTYKDLEPTHEQICAYTRTLGKEKILVLLNFSEQAQSYSLKEDLQIDKTLISTHAQANVEKHIIHLKPLEAIVFQLENIRE